MEYILVGGGFLLIFTALLMYFTSASKSCWCGHHWSRWSTPIDVRGTYFHFSTGKEIPFIDKVQNRECTRCGKMQQYEVTKE